METPNTLKLKLIRIFRHMKYNSEIFSKAKGICMEILENFPMLSFTLVILETLTSLSEQSLIDIPSYIQFLISFYGKDSRISVKKLILDSLNVLFLRAPHFQFPLAFLFEILSEKDENIYHSLKIKTLLLLKNIFKYQNLQIQTSHLHILETLLTHPTFAHLSALIFSFLFSHPIQQNSLVLSISNLISFYLYSYYSPLSTFSNSLSSNSSSSINNDENKSISSSSSSSFNKNVDSIFLSAIVRISNHHPSTLPSFANTIIGVFPHTKSFIFI